MAGFSGGTGAPALKFSYTVAEGDEDTDGFSLEADSLSHGNGVIEDGSGNSAELSHAELDDQAPIGSTASVHPLWPVTRPP